MSLTPARVDFVGVDRVLQGTDWERTVPMAQDMTAYDPALTVGAVLRGACKSADLATTYMSTAAGTMVLSFDDPLTLRVRFTSAGTSAAAAFNDGVWDVEAVNGLTLFVDRIAEGYAEMSREVTS
jgi:hypothetical protein